MAAAGTVATLLPGAAFYLKLGRFAPARMLIDEHVPVALATDVNPGGGFTPSMPFIMALACFGMGLTLEEALVGATINAAHSLGRDERVGSLEPGKQMDLVVVNGSAVELLRPGTPSIRTVIKRGRVVHREPWGLPSPSDRRPDCGCRRRVIRVTRLHMSNLTALTVTDLLEAFASSTPTPGGGSASALAGAIGASLLMMVAALPKTRTGPTKSARRSTRCSGCCATAAIIWPGSSTRTATPTTAVISAYRLPKASERKGGPHGGNSGGTARRNGSADRRDARIAMRPRARGSPSPAAAIHQPQRHRRGVRAAARRPERRGAGTRGSTWRACTTPGSPRGAEAEGRAR